MLACIVKPYYDVTFILNWDKVYGMKYSRYASSHIQKEVSILAETEVPKLTDENVELQDTQVVYGDYNPELLLEKNATSGGGVLVFKGGYHARVWPLNNGS